MSDMMVNPFLNIKPLNIKRFTMDDIDNESWYDKNKIFKDHKYLYILTKKTDIIIPLEFYKWEISCELFESVSNNLILYRVDISIIKNKFFFDNMIIISRENLERYNNLSYNLNDNNLVTLILNINYNDITKYMEMYNNLYKLDEFIKYVIINKYFNNNNNLHKLINNIYECQYWTYSINCNLNNTKIFSNRTFTFKLARLVDKNISFIIKDILDDIKYDNQYDKINNYEYKYNISKNYKLNYWYSVDKNDINILFNNMNNNDRFYMFCNLMISKKYCHLVVNNYEILTMMQTVIITHAQLFRYLLSYSWIKFYTDELLLDKNIKIKDVIEFDINTASLLPVFPFDHKRPKLNPYMPLLVSDLILDPSRNFCGIGYYNSSTYWYKGICNLEEFKIRLNIYTCGSKNIDIFSNIDFAKYNMAITGSTITACIQKEHPLMNIFTDKSLELNIYHYFNEYYAKADLDIMFKNENNFIFIDNVKLFFQDIIQSLNKYYQSFDNNDVVLTLNKTEQLFVTEKFINENIHFDDNKKNTNKIDYINSNIDSQEILDIFRPYYIDLYNKYLDSLNENIKEKYNYELEYNGTFKIYISEKSINPINIEIVYKYNITSPYLLHNFELFNIKNDFFVTVSRFHLPCVRGYYNGTNVYLTPSCISAHMTYMNIDYRYIYGTKDPLDILHKYRMRGFGTWLNKKEKEIMKNYIIRMPFWTNLYSGNVLFAPLPLNSKLFRPRYYNADHYKNDTFVDLKSRYNDVTLPPLVSDLKNSTIDFNRIIANKFNISSNDIYGSLNVINACGKITPVIKSIIDLTFELLF